MKEKRKVFLFLIGVLFFAGCSSGDTVYLEAFSTEETTSEFMEGIKSEPDADGVCYVYVCGAVAEPGVYVLPEQSRVYEAIEMAGGLTADASIESVNQADVLSDGQMLKIPTVEEAWVDESEYGSREESDGRININTATAAELMTLPGVGQSKADSIIAYREEHGAFLTADELMNVTGIKEGVFNRIKEYIKVD